MSVTSQAYTRLGLGRLPWGTAYSFNAMAALNTGISARFWATSPRDIKAVRLNWATISAAGTVQVRIETSDPATGKPTGTLYDANATKSVTPTIGFQLVTFDTLPTTGLTFGQQYHLVILTTVVGTTQTLYTYISDNRSTRLPATILTASDGTTRSNFAEVAASAPAMTLIYDDDVEDPIGYGGVAGGFTLIKQVFGANRHGTLLTCAVPVQVQGLFAAFGAVNTGSPQDLRLKLLNSSHSIMTDGNGQDINLLLDKDTLTGIGSTRYVEVNFAPVVLPAGTYRVILVQADEGTTSSNRYNLSAATLASANLYGPFQHTTATADTGPWTDTATELAACGMILDDIVAAAGGGGGPGPRIYSPAVVGAIPVY